ncbi:Uncharacterised protein [Yersinia pekkanenii]|uniref:Uncharacterized protein n=1 Tax=Yersinia pekkanenii TaxID=1288385 RepID=A0A0T9RR74_9GAMM|nr:Uncharacterised protein [Yersinia pekkanenii]
MPVSQIRCRIDNATLPVLADRNILIGGNRRHRPARIGLTSALFIVVTEAHLVAHGQFDLA